MKTLDDKNSLECIGSGKLRVKYSKGYLEKATAQYNLLKQMKEFYNEKKGFNLTVEVNLLYREAWEKKYDLPYGLPFVMLEEISVIVLPATEDGIVVESMLVFKDIVPQNIKDILSEINYSYEDAVKQFPDLIGLHEIGHTLTIENGNDNLNNWFNEFMATYFAYAFMRNKAPELAKLWEANAYITYLDGSKPEYTSMDALDEVYCDMPVPNYDWYQKQFTLLAEKVYDAMGLDFIDSVRDAFGNDEVKGDETFDRLRTISPIFDEWIAEINAEYNN
ncbi:hypothetical protein PV797_03720 [Clostridiaceae bacterium M8S5]|nr:hypothetical protein PV797_03720 [Clostridiaceae bacterium M8S5]